jgi:hypothetical protein
MSKLFSDGHIISIIPAAPDLWLPDAQSSDEPRGYEDFGFGTLVTHQRVAYFALVEADRAEEHGWDEEPRFDRWVEARSADDCPLDSLDYSGSGPCDLVKPGEWHCAGHFDPVDEAEWKAGRERRRLAREARKTARVPA